MSAKFSKDPLRGMEDLYPEDLRVDKYLLSVIDEVADLYGYEEFETPLLEPIEIFAAKSSEELVNEQSFYVEKKKGEKLILRPELTPSLARMISRKSQEIKKPIRWYSTPTCYRYERPQKGRRREFKQNNFDILGENTLYAELEIFNVVVDILTGLNASSEHFQIYYNNRRFIDAFCEQVIGVPKGKLPLIYKLLDKSDKMEESEFESYVIDSLGEEHLIQGIFKLRENENLKDLLEQFDDIPNEFYKSQGYKELLKLEELIKDAEIKEFCSFSSSVVRGLDYYTGTVFEVFDTGKENRRAIFGGGRYDDLLSLFSDEPLSGIGFGMGVLMLRLFLETYDLIPADIKKKDFTDTIYITCVNEDVADYALKIAKTLRSEDIPSIMDYRFESLKNQLSKANDLGVGISLIIGPKEKEKNLISIKNMKSEEQKTIDLEDLIDEIFNILDTIEEI